MYKFSGKLCQFYLGGFRADLSCGFEFGNCLYIFCSYFTISQE